VSKLTALLPGYATVARASEVLHLAPRSVRDLIYAGRLPSTRMGRRHFIRASDLDAERRRRLRLPLPRSRPARHAAPRRLAAVRPPVDPAVRAQRMIERTSTRAHWARMHPAAESHVPFRVLIGAETAVCASCGTDLSAVPRRVEHQPGQSEAPRRLCVRCARRELLGWSDERRAEATAARRLAHSLGAATNEGEQVMRAA
jgi:excisionase family DNA binding protein